MIIQTFTCRDAQPGRLLTWASKCLYRHSFVETHNLGVSYPARLNVYTDIRSWKRTTWASPLVKETPTCKRDALVGRLYSHTTNINNNFDTLNKTTARARACNPCVALTKILFSTVCYFCIRRSGNLSEHPWNKMKRFFAFASFHILPSCNIKINSNGGTSRHIAP